MRVAGLGLWVVVIAGSLVAMAPPAIAHPPAILNEAGERAVREEIAAFREELASAIRAGKAARLRRFYAPSFTHTRPDGLIDDRAARLKTVLTGDPVIETADVADLIIRVPNDWVAIATGRSRLRVAGKTTEVRWTTVYTRAGLSWVVAASHETRLGEQPRK